MSKISFETKYGNTVTNKLSYPEAVNEQIYNSVNAGKFEGFLPLRENKKRNDVSLECIVQGLTPVSRYFCEDVTKKVFLGFVQEVIRRLRICEMNMIDPNNLVLNLDMIYIDPYQKQYKFIYWPLVNNKNAAPPRDFFKNLPSCVRFKNYTDTSFLSAYSQFFNTTAPFALNSFDKMIAEISQEKDSSSSSEIIAATTQKSDKHVKVNIFETNKTSIEYDPFAPATSGSSKIVTARGPSADYTFCPNCGTKNEIDSSFCSLCGKSLRYPEAKSPPQKKVVSKSVSVQTKPTISSKHICATLTRVRTGESFTLNKPVFKVGSNSEICDIVIRDNPYISRNHANIITKKSRFYIVDRKSANNTFLNGMILPRETEIEIFSGAKIRLANEEFIFKTE